MPTIDSSKRRRIASGCAHNIASLPDALFADVAAFLPRPSRALFAAAVTAPSSSWKKFHWKRQPSATGKAILSWPSEKWDVLDFADIEKSLAWKVTDDDIGAILVCIDAANNLTNLKLTGCTNITGCGLEPLRGSIAVQQIDLSLAGQHESADIESDPSISETAVLPILESIIETGQNSLKHLQFPRKWLDKQPAEMDNFLCKYNRVLESHGPSCSNCEARLNAEIGYIGQIDQRRDSLFYGLQISTCYKCMKPFCYECHNADGHVCNNFCGKCDRNCCLDCSETAGFCDKCEANLCSGCTSVEECQECGENFCRECGPINKCDCWDGHRCKECAPNYFQCEKEGCNAKHCSGCCIGGDIIVDCCDDCETTLCSKCRVLECSKGPCSGCQKMIAEAPL